MIKSGHKNLHQSLVCLISTVYYTMKSNSNPHN